MKRFGVALASTVSLASVAACAGEPAEPGPPEDARSGGDTTVFLTTREAFAAPLANLVGTRRDDFFLGNAVFNRGWVTAPSSVSDFDGLGPLFNATNCSGCHFKDGRGRPPEQPDQSFLSMLLRIGVPGRAPNGGPMPEPIYGDQLQGQGILGVPAEGEARVRYTELPGAFADGTAFSLRRPSYVIESLGYGPMRPDVLVSPRVAPALLGLGLLEAVPESAILERADPEDANGDGISGRPNRVWDEVSRTTVLGRFGWKANQPSLFQQNAAAFLGDMGITSGLFPIESCTTSQEKCTLAPGGPGPQLRADLLDQVTFYTRTLAVPARRAIDQTGVRVGHQVFERIGCGSCHTETLVTGDVPDFPELARQTIHPYADLLLHDMGPELADGRPDFEATGFEWRTPPLWGIGLVQTVNRHLLLMHDGRARGFAEAVLWHGGEATRSRDAFRALSPTERNALLTFLGHL